MNLNTVRLIKRCACQLAHFKSSCQSHQRILNDTSSHVLSTKDEPRQTDQGWHYVKLMLNRFTNLHKWLSMCYVVGGWQLSRIQVSHVAGTLRPCHAAGSAWWSASLISLRAKDPVATTGSGHPYFLAWPLLAWGAGGQFLPSISVMQFRQFYANSSLQWSSFQEQFDEIPISVLQTLEWADQLNTWMAKILGTRYMDGISLASYEFACLIIFASLKYRKCFVSLAVSAWRCRGRQCAEGRRRSFHAKILRFASHSGGSQWILHRKMTNVNPQTLKHMIQIHRNYIGIIYNESQELNMTTHDK